MISSIEWIAGKVKFIDQTQLPLIESYIFTSDYHLIIDAIKKLSIRGAPLLGIAAAYGVALAAIEYSNENIDSLKLKLSNVVKEIKATRPTAVNLFWALERMQKIIDNCNNQSDLVEKIIIEAKNIHEEDKQMCESIGRIGSEIIPDDSTILTHCNTGALATGGNGTVLNVILTAHRMGKKVHVFVDETRPLLQGARLTTWELLKNNIDVTLITDSTAAFLMQKKRINLIITGADRITAYGYVANKIGTYSLSLAAKMHQIPFYVAAPTSTIDLNISEDNQIIIEERDSDEIRKILNQQIAPHDVKVYNPAFDITPPEFISGIITERKILYPPFSKSLQELKI